MWAWNTVTRIAKRTFVRSFDDYGTPSVPFAITNKKKHTHHTEQNLLPFPFRPNTYSFFHHFILLINYEYIHAKTVGSFRHTLTNTFRSHSCRQIIFRFDFSSILPFHHRLNNFLSVWLLRGCYICCVMSTPTRTCTFLLAGRTWFSEKKMKADKKKIIMLFDGFHGWQYWNDWMKFRLISVECVPCQKRNWGLEAFYFEHYITENINIVISSKFIYLFRFSRMSKLAINEHHVHTLSLNLARTIYEQSDGLLIGRIQFLLWPLLKCISSNGIRSFIIPWNIFCDGDEALSSVIFVSVIAFR